MKTYLENIELYISLFRGRQDIYAKYWEKNGRSGYSPAYQFNWDEFLAFKAKGGTIKDFPNKRLLPLTQLTIEKHLFGQWSIGIYPLLEDNSSYFIAADFDRKNWKEESSALIDICRKYKIPTYLERSKSGNGGHVWIFFEEAYPAEKSRGIVLELIREALNFSEFDKEISFDRLFPNQDFHNQKGFGNLIALPLQGKAVNEGNTCFLDPDTFVLIEDQFEYLNKIKKISINKLDLLYKKLIGSNLPTTKLTKDIGQITICIKNQIFINKSELGNKLTAFLKENLNFFNQEYLMKKRIGKSTYKTEKYFKLIEEEDEKVMIPRGFIKELINFLEENSIKYRIIDERKLLDPISFKSKIKLYDHQKQALSKFIDKDFGVLVAPPGAGKTIMGLELIVRKKQPALILVHRKQLFDQWIERIESFLKIPKKDIGQINSSKKKIGKKITIGMMQSFSRMEDEDVKKFKNQFGTIIVDECHHIPAKTFRKVISNLDSYYLYGLTATPKRKHNDEKLIFLYIGDILEDMKSHQNKSDEKLSHVVIKKTDLEIPFEHMIDDPKILSKVLIFDSKRNKMILEDISLQVETGKKILVLTERKEHIEVLNLYLKKSFETIAISGGDSMAKRKLKLDQIKLGHFQILISTGQFFGEGLDVKNLDCLFLIYPFSFEGKLIQYIGRIQRSKNNKLIFDYRDKKVDYFEKLFKKRNRYYKKIKKDNTKSNIANQTTLFQD